MSKHGLIPQQVKVEVVALPERLDIDAGAILNHEHEGRWFELTKCADGGASYIGVVAQVGPGVYTFVCLDGNRLFDFLDGRASQPVQQWKVTKFFEAHIKLTEIR